MIYWIIAGVLFIIMGVAIHQYMYIVDRTPMCGCGEKIYDCKCPVMTKEECEWLYNKGKGRPYQECLQSFPKAGIIDGITEGKVYDTIDSTRTGSCPD
jgi:hypothetical protein